MHVKDVPAFHLSLGRTDERRWSWTVQRCTTGCQGHHLLRNHSSERVSRAEGEVSGLARRNGMGVQSPSAGSLQAALATMIRQLASAPSYVRPLQALLCDDITQSRRRIDTNAQMTLSDISHSRLAPKMRKAGFFGATDSWSNDQVAIKRRAARMDQPASVGTHRLPARLRRDGCLLPRGLGLPSFRRFASRVEPFMQLTRSANGQTPSEKAARDGTLPTTASSLHGRLGRDPPLMVKSCQGPCPAAPRRRPIHLLALRVAETVSRPHRVGKILRLCMSRNAGLARPSLRNSIRRPPGHQYTVVASKYCPRQEVPVRAFGCMHPAYRAPNPLPPMFYPSPQKGSTTLSGPSAAVMSTLAPAEKWPQYSASRIWVPK
ncbi:hypothetical protein BCR34DRAFT_585018 [Clohesyomyces aquaticus]|uniref:Uncharacterized protein n=1 Tax=Clohesyomyces aquaticus TaxID=1231657 RepID=A0A1Y2A0R0_9PLEO|nr:hypothetical protein BCR34DRAFT_585018 [Clohesyomyces aquaticus]